MTLCLHKYRVDLAASSTTPGGVLFHYTFVISSNALWIVGNLLASDRYLLDL